MSSRFIKVSIADDSLSLTLRRGSEAYGLVYDMIPILSSADKDELFSAFGEMVLRIEEIINELSQFPPDNQTYISGTANQRYTKFLGREIYYYEGDSAANKLFTGLKFLEIIKTLILNGARFKVEEASSLSS